MKMPKNMMNHAGKVIDVVDLGITAVNVYRGKESAGSAAKKIVKKGTGVAVRRGVGALIGGTVLGTGAVPVVIGFLAVSVAEFAIDCIWKN